jgi:hypothetical protein
MLAQNGARCSERLCRSWFVKPFDRPKPGAGKQIHCASEQPNRKRNILVCHGFTLSPEQTGELGCLGSLWFACHRAPATNARTAKARLSENPVASPATHGATIAAFS